MTKLLSILLIFTLFGCDKDSCDVRDNKYSFNHRGMNGNDCAKILKFMYQNSEKKNV